MLLQFCLAESIRWEFSHGKYFSTDPNIHQKYFHPPFLAELPDTFPCRTSKQGTQIRYTHPLHVPNRITKNTFGYAVPPKPNQYLKRQLHFCLRSFRRQGNNGGGCQERASLWFITFHIWIIFIIYRARIYVTDELIYYTGSSEMQAKRSNEERSRVGVVEDVAVRGWVFSPKSLTKQFS